MNKKLKMLSIEFDYDEEYFSTYSSVEAILNEVKDDKCGVYINDVIDFNIENFIKWTSNWKYNAIDSCYIAIICDEETEEIVFYDYCMENSSPLTFKGQELPSDFDTGYKIRQKFINEYVTSEINKIELPATESDYKTLTDAFSIYEEIFHNYQNNLDEEKVLEFLIKLDEKDYRKYTFLFTYYNDLVDGVRGEWSENFVNTLFLKLGKEKFHNLTNGIYKYELNYKL